MTKIAIIGVGKMGGALAKALGKNLLLSNSPLTNQSVAKKAEIIILAVKPAVVKEVCEQIGPVVKTGALVISIAAGVKIKSLAAWLNRQDQAIVRAMPNLPLQIGQGMTGWTANKFVSQAQKQLVKEIFSAGGREIFFNNEAKLDQVTALSGSGPAYFFYVAEALISAGQRLGITTSEAKVLVYQTFSGAAELLLQSKLSAEQLRLAVTSKGGTTEAAVKVFEKAKLAAILKQGVTAAYRRAQALGS